MNAQAITDQVITVTFTEPVEGIDPDDGATVLASRHRLVGVGLRQDRVDTLFLDAAGEVVGRWPTGLVERVDWSPKLSITVAGGRSPAAREERLRALRERYPQAFKRWQPDEDEQLAAEFGDGLTIREMAQRHGRGRGGIVSRLVRLELVEPGTPTREIDGRAGLRAVAV
jgi:hypothetical protein